MTNPIDRDMFTSRLGNGRYAKDFVPRSDKLLLGGWTGSDVRGADMPNNLGIPGENGGGVRNPDSKTPFDGGETIAEGTGGGRTAMYLALAAGLIFFFVLMRT